ncbi:SCO1431 family membrane protein [Streptomyces sp. NPDC015127]
MTSTAATADRAMLRARTGGPDDESSVLEHVLGWTLVVVIAMLITQLGLL